MKHYTLVLVLLLSVVFAAVMLLRPLLQPAPLPEQVADMVLPEYQALTAFQLTDGFGQDFDLAKLNGHWTLLFFGYTHCPDICPTTLATLRNMTDELKKTPGYYQDLRVVFVSVDPKRDKPKALQQFVTFFNADFLSATGEKAQIDKLAKQVGAAYMFDGDTNSDDYIVNHSATVAIIDPDARWVARYNPPHKAKEMAEQFRLLHDYFQ